MIKSYITPNFAINIAGVLLNAANWRSCHSCWRKQTCGSNGRTAAVVSEGTAHSEDPLSLEGGLPQSEDLPKAMVGVTSLKDLLASSCLGPTWTGMLVTRQGLGGKKKTQVRTGGGSY